MPTETIRFKTLGANPAISSTPVTIDSSGKGATSITLTGYLPGVDTLQAFMDSKSLSSNLALATWQAPNGPISVGGINGYVGNGNGTATFPAGLTAANLNLTPPQPFSSMMFNTHPYTIFPSYLNANGNSPPSQPGDAAPFINNGINTSGQYTSDTTVQGVSGSFNMSLTGSFVVLKAGPITFRAYVNTSFILAIPGTTLTSGPTYFNGVNVTPIKGYAPTAGLNSNYNDFTNGNNWATVPFTVNFPAPGVYDFECLVVPGLYGEREFCLLANNAPIPAINLTPLPAAPAPGTGSLVLTPVEAPLNIQGSTQVFSLQISGITFTQKPYVPLYEGQTGQFYITDDGIFGGPFGFPPLPSAIQIDGQAAASLFSLSGSDNSSYQNRLSIQAVTSSVISITPLLGGGTVTGPAARTVYSVAYNGAAVDPGVASTQLVVTYDELAWYNPNSKAFDRYAISSLGGGSKAQVQVNWLVKPAIASVSPLTLPGDGATHTITVTLAKPLPPVQANLNAVFTGGGGITVLGSAPNILSTGFLTGWTVNVRTTAASGSVQSSLSLLAGDTITYLSGDSFLTNQVTYISGQIATITT